MYRSLLTFVPRIQPGIVASSIASSHQSASLPFVKTRATAERYQSTKANNLKKVIPEFWIVKMKTGFTYHDVDGDGYITEKDFIIWTKEMEKLFPNMSEEQKKTLETKPSRVWGELLDGKGKGPDYKVTESMYIEKLFNIVSREGSEDRMRKEWRDVFEVMDLNQDGVIAKNEHRLFFEARKNVDPNGAIVAFSAMDKDMDGKITCDEYVNTGVEFFFNFADETKPSKYFFGPLVKM